MGESMSIEKEVIGALHSGDSIHLLAHTGKLIELEGTGVGARWSERGLWQTFTVETYGGGAVYSGDAVFLKAHTGRFIEVSGVAVQANWWEVGEWQTFVLEKSALRRLIE